MDYRTAGVDVEAGRAFVDQIKKKVESTFRPEVLGGLGGFGGYFQIPPGYQEPVLVSGTDGVGTKLKIAQAVNRHDTIGIDLVAMCVNDILTSGAEPLFFLDYLATGCLNPQQLAEVVSGIVEGCHQSGCSLLGGETAEMPGFYQTGEYDVAGFCVGIVEKSQLLNGDLVQVGDVAIALQSSGVHSNGFSLVRKLIETQGYHWQDCPKELGGKSLGETLLNPTQIYVKPVLDGIKAGLEIHGMAHITGGGLPENLPRCLPLNHGVKLIPNSWERLPIFQWIQTTGQLSDLVMLETFNLGVGFVVIVAPEQKEMALNWFISQGISSFHIGNIMAGNQSDFGL
ncbi:MAG: phosphoribosylformylglycinamidine cyclo-ligase [Microcystaceae cyanobacterium]